MNDRRQAATLSDLSVGKGLIGGPFGSNLVKADYVDSGIPVVRGQNLSKGRWVDFEDCVYVSQEKVDRDLHRNLAQAGDLIFTQRGTLGQVALVQPSFSDRAVVSQSQMRLRVDGTVADALYVYYCTTAADFLEQIQSNAIVAGVPHINLGILGRLTIPLPPPAVQRRIAGVLGALDDLIDTNKRLIDTHLLAADAIALAEEPSGSQLNFAEVCAVFGGGTPSTKKEGFWGGDIMWATPTDMTALPSPYLFSTSRRITQAGLDGCSSKLFPVGSILMTSRATIGSFAVNQQPVSVNQGFIVVEPLATHDRWFLFHEMRRRVPEFIQRANGSTFLEISRGTFKSLPITWPDEEIRRNLHEKLDPIHSAAAALQAEIAQLSVTRDELLPLLLSGAVTVSESAA